MARPRASAALLKSVRLLARKGPRSGRSEFLVEGPKLVGEVLSAGWELRTILTTAERSHDPDVQAIVDRASGSGVEVLLCTGKDMASVSPTEQPQGILAVVTQRQHTMDEMLGEPVRFLLALDGLQDPGNVGTCIRSAEWFGAAGVVLGTGCASMYNDKTVRASAGSVFRLPCVEAADLSRELASLRESGFHIIGADQQAPRPYTDLTEPRKTVLVLGSEAAGFSASVRAQLESTVSIPRHGHGESLNVSIAGAVILSHLAGFHGTGEA